MSDGRGDDVKKIWQSQPTSTRNVSWVVQKKTRSLRSITRKILFAGFVGPVVVGLLYAYSIKSFPSLSQDLHPLFAFALVWSLAGMYFLHRGMWSEDEPAGPGLTSGLVFCRREIQRQRDLVNRQLLWILGPVLLSIGVFTFALAMISTSDRGIFPNGLPFIGAIVIWAVAYSASRLKEQQRLQQEIDELDQIERDSSEP